MFGTILSRLILAELVKVFVLSLVALTGMFLLAGLIQEAGKLGLSPSQILMAIPLLIPNTLPYTIPATTLFATCVVYGRMAHDNEITVLRSAGVHILHLFKPAILLGTTAAAITFWLYLDVIPSTQRIMRDRLVNDAEELLYGMLKRDGCIRHPSMPYVIFVKEIQGKRLIDVIFKKRAKPREGVNQAYAGYDVTVRAKEAKLRLDPANNQLLVDMENVNVVGDQETNGMVKERTEAMPIPDQIFGKDSKFRPSSQTWEELRARRIEVQNDFLEKAEKIAKVEADLKLLSPESPYRVLHKSELNAQNYSAREDKKLLLNIDAEFQIRPALAFGCLCFVLIGAPVGIWASRSDYLSVFMVCFLPTVFVYYPFMMSGTKFAKDGRFDALPAIWAANAILFTIATGLIWRLTKR